MRSTLVNFLSNPFSPPSSHFSSLPSVISLRSAVKVRKFTRPKFSLSLSLSRARSWNRHLEVTSSTVSGTGWPAPAISTDNLTGYNRSAPATASRRRRSRHRATHAVMGCAENARSRPPRSSDRSRPKTMLIGIMISLSGHGRHPTGERK